MSLHSWLQNLRTALTPRRGQRHRGRQGSHRAARYRPNLEVLEDRLTPSFGWDGTYYSEPPPGVVWKSSSTLLADVTSDGLRDRIELISYQVVVRPGRGDGTFGDPIRSGLTGVAHTLAVADFNGDARLDVFTLNTPGWWYPWDGQPWGSVLLGHGNGQFSHWEDHAFGWSMNGAPWNVGFGDIFGTGRTDVVVGSGDYVGDDYVYSYLVLRKNGDWGPLPPSPPPQISISDVTKAEGKKGKTNLFTFTVTLSAAYDQPVTMSYQTVNGTATTSDSDYIAKSGTLTFAPGETTKTITIEVKCDSKKESSETFYLDLFGLSSNALFTKNRGLGTILNDD